MGVSRLNWTDEVSFANTLGAAITQKTEGNGWILRLAGNCREVKQNVYKKLENCETM